MNKHILKLSFFNDLLAFIGFIACMVMWMSLGYNKVYMTKRCFVIMMYVLIICLNVFSNIVELRLRHKLNIKVNYGALMCRLLINLVAYII